MAFEPGDRLGPLEVVGPLGEGGMGVVYRARDTRLGRDVAVKVLPEPLSQSPERLARLEQEARSLASLSHPNVATVYGLEEHRGSRCLVMELVPGATLAERLSRGPLSQREALVIGRQLAEGLEAAHAAGLIHRDLKPSNVKVTPEGRVKLLDFGLAKPTPGDGSDSLLPTGSPLTREGVIVGTAAYMSPEQARGQVLDRRTDVWAFGCVLYELLTGRRAFPADTLSDTLVAVLEREPNWDALPSTTPAAVRSLVQRCLQKDPSRRLHDIADARIELDEVVAAAGPSSGKADAVASRHRRRPLILVSLGALALTLVAVGFAIALRARARSVASAEAVTLAVLPFHVLTDSPSDRELGLGLADDVITHLANAGPFRVRPTQAVLRYLGQTPDLQEAGRALGATSVLTGTIRKQPAGFRVTAQLARVSDGVSYWGRSYDVAADALPGLEDRITEHVAAALGFHLGREARAVNERRYTESGAAYEAYLRGRASMVYGSENGTRAAIAAFEDALRVDSGYALAHAGLSMASAQMHLRFASSAEAEAWRERALREAERARSLDADLAETHQALADVYGKAEFEWQRVIEESRRALEINPRLELPRAYVARAFYHLGLLERADATVRSVLAREPDNRSDVLRTLGITALLSGRFAEAVPALEEVQKLSGRPLSDYYLALACYYSGDTARAVSMLDELSRGSSAASAQRSRAALAAILAARGERVRATELVGQVTGGKYVDHHVAAGLGGAYAQLGRPDEALQWLRKAADTGFPCHPWYARDPLLAPLRGNPQFETWLEELRSKLAESRQRYATD